MWTHIITFITLVSKRGYLKRSGSGPKLVIHNLIIISYRQGEQKKAWPGS